MSATVAVLLVYLVLLIGLAAWSRRETHSLSGYFLAGKKLPYWVVAFSTNATGESGWLLLGLTGMGYLVGAQAFWVMVGEVVGITLAWTLVSKRLKKLGDETDSITVPDVLAAHFDDRKHVLRGIAVFIILSMVTAYVSAQMMATGKAFSSFMDIDYATAVAIGAVIIIAYTFIGGYKAVAYTDVLQGVLMLIGLIVVPIVAIAAAGGWGEVTGGLREIDPGLMSVWGTGGNGIVAWIAIVSFVAIGLPYMGVPQLAVRFMSVSNIDDLGKARNISIAVIILFDIGAITAGMAGRVLFPGLEDAETILPVLSSELLPPILTGVMMVIILSAIMSTVDSLLLLASSAVVRDGIQKIGGSLKSDAVLSNYGKAVTLIVGIAGAAFAISEPKVIFWFVLFAWSGLGAAFGPVILCALYYKGTTLQGAIAGMLGGFLTSVLWVLVFKSQTYELYEMIPGFIVGVALTFIVSHMTLGSRKTAA
jgi:sodium/proline symporter